MLVPLASRGEVHHSTLAAFEGLFLASLISTLFWTLLIFTIFYCGGN